VDARAQAGIQKAQTAADAANQLAMAASTQAETPTAPPNQRQLTLNRSTAQ